MSAEAERALMNEERWGIVVDDRPKQAEAIAKVLTNGGLPSKGFTDPDEALEFARQHRGSVVFAMFDVCLGEKSGIEYVRTFREEQLAHDIVLLTGYPDTISPSTEQELRKLGVPIESKPPDLESLLSQKLRVWRTITQRDIAQTSSPGPVAATVTASDPTVAAVAQAIAISNFQQKVDYLTAEVGRLQGLIVDRKHQETLHLGNEQVNLSKEQVKMGKRGWTWTVVGVFVAAVATIIGVLAYLKPASTDKSAVGGKPAAKIILAENQFPQSAATIVAYRKGYFSKRGLDVDVRRFPSGKLALDAVLGGGANFATVAETPVVFAGFADLPAVVLATISYSNDSCKVAARKDLGVAVPSGLKGKKVATAVGTSAEFFMEAFLKGNGLSRSDVEVVTLKPEDMPSALNRGDIAAFFIWEPYIYLANKLLGDRLAIFSGQQFYTETFNLATTKDYAERNPAVVKSMLEALIDAEGHIKSDPADAIASVADQIGMDPAVLQGIWPAYNIGIILDQSLIKEMQAEADWAVKSQKVKAGSGIPDFYKMIDPEPLRLLKPEAVRIR